MCEDNGRANATWTRPAATSETYGRNYPTPPPPEGHICAPESFQWTSFEASTTKAASLFI